MRHDWSVTTGLDRKPRTSRDFAKATESRQIVERMADERVQRFFFSRCREFRGGLTRYRPVNSIVYHGRESRSNADSCLVAVVAGIKWSTVADHAQ